MTARQQLDFGTQLCTVDFHGQVLQVVDREGRPYVAIKPICVNIGIDWEGQRQRILRDSVLYEGACMIKAPSYGGEQEMLCLPLEYLNGWLFGIDEKRVAPQIKESLILYKEKPIKHSTTISRADMPSTSKSFACSPRPLTN
jgi:hypothetical protein